jgi:hypothetical protein
VKRCKKCGEVKPLDEFYKSAGMRDGHRSDCKACNLLAKKEWYAANREAVIEKVKRWQREHKDVVNARNRAYREAHPDAMREWDLKTKFGISISDYDGLLEAQGGDCAICGKPQGKISLHVDHDHESGEIRGLLCLGCNNALGQFKDDCDLLARAAGYLRRDLLTLVTEDKLREMAVRRAGELRGASV